MPRTIPIVLATAAALGAAAVAAPQRDVARTVPVTVYLVRNEHVAPVRRVAPAASPLRGALVALLRGPTATERRAGYGTTIPAGTRLRGLAVSRGVATVDLTRRFASGGGSLSMLLRVAQVVHTATQTPLASRVAFRLDGVPVSAIGGEGVIVSPPVGRPELEGQAPAILVEQPLPGDRVPLRFTVRGTANVYEARVDVELRSADGRLLARRKLMASAGSGTRGTFATRLSLAKPARATLVVSSPSAKNGRPMNVARVPVRVG